MLMRWGTLVVIFFVIFVGYGCSGYSEEKVYKAVHKRLAGLETYSCEAQVYVKGNKGPGQFKIKQWFCMPDKYRIEVIEPQIMQGKTTVYDGSRFWIYYPYIDRMLFLEDTEFPAEGNLFLGFFLRDMLEGEKLSYCLDHWEEAPVMVIELPVPGGCKYRVTQKLMIHSKKMQPLVLEMFDINGAVTTRVEFLSFQFNPGIENDFFKGEPLPHGE